MRTNRWLPVEPLARLVDARGGAKAVYNLSEQRRYTRSKARGKITILAADALAVAIGYHPTEVWGDQWCV